MNFVRLLFIFVSVALSCGATAQTIYNVTQADVDSILVALQHTIEHKEEYSAARYARIREKEKQLTGADEGKRIGILKELISDHMNFRSKEVFKWIGMLKSTDEYKKRGDLYYWTECKEAQCYSTMGLTHKAISLLHSLNEISVSDEMKTIHDDILMQTYNWEMSTFNFTFPLSEKEEKERLELQKAMQENSFDESTGVFAKVSELMETGRAREGIDLLRPLSPTMKGQELTYFYATMSDIYMHLNDTVSAIYALALTSQRDLEAANADYMCLPLLVEYLSKTGDIDNAYHFLLCCIDDARLYPAYFLSGETSNIFPVINNEYLLMKERKEKSEAMVTALVVALVIAIIILIFIVLYIRNKNRMAAALEQKNAELQKANDVKTVFIQNITHELHTPLNAVSGFAQVLASGIDDYDADNRREMAESIYRGAVDLTKQLDNMIALSRIDSTDMPHVTISSVPLSEVIDAVRSNTELPTDKELSFTIDNSVDPSATLTTNKKLLAKTIGLLIDNAIKFTAKGSIVLSIEKSGDTFRFIVTDNGPGIPKGEEEKIFDRFYKVNRFIPGAGIGLSLCRSFTTILGGTIHVDPSHKPGARFVITIN